MTIVLVARGNLIYVLPSLTLGGCSCHRTLTFSWIIFDFIFKLAKD